MANAYLRTRAGAINAAHSQVSIFLFTRFLASLPDLVAAERDMVGLSGRDPALDRWIAAAETARATTLARAQDLGRATAGTMFGAVAELFVRVMTSDDPEGCAQLRDRALHDRAAFLLPGPDRMSLDLNQMIHFALDQLEIYCALDNGVVDGDALALATSAPGTASDEALSAAA